MHTLVQLITDDDGDLTHDNSWHWIMDLDGADRLLCNGHVFGEGESNAKYKLKNVKKGGITCGKCLSIIKEIKSIKL